MPATSAAQQAAAPAPTSGQRESLLADWGGRIRAQVERARRAAPPGMRGRAVVALTLAADGALAGVRIVQSSGAAAVDGAALDAVSRAAPFPAAPGALGTGPFAFNLPVRFGG
ncbi:MAG: hypothetical protein CVT80_07495 [Alphaproteobacteria bacterium HGW-Alphaproteobacteria-2]|nr:MAG: hypothetical protein CVT80_07495 [Alphaproteobacteria bacterium HGW-Alphaproteobacteria-2]